MFHRQGLRQRTTQIVSLVTAVFLLWSATVVSTAGSAYAHADKGADADDLLVTPHVSKEANYDRLVYDTEKGKREFFALHHGHTDIFDLTADNSSSLTMKVKEDVTGNQVIRDVNTVWLNVLADRYTKMPDAYHETLGEAAYMLPISQKDNSLWPGLDSFATDKHFATTRLVFDDVSTPEDASVKMYSLKGFGTIIPRAVHNGKGQFSLSKGSILDIGTPRHEHMAWLFSKAGVYTLDVHAEGLTTKGKVAARSQTHRYVWLVNIDYPTLGAMYEILGEQPPVKDSDNDGVVDSQDTCVDTPQGEKVDDKGCSDAQNEPNNNHDKDNNAGGDKNPDSNNDKSPDTDGDKDDDDKEKDADSQIDKEKDNNKTKNKDSDNNNRRIHAVAAPDNLSTSSLPSNRVTAPTVTRNEECIPTKIPVTSGSKSKAAPAATGNIVLNHGHTDIFNVTAPDSTTLNLHLKEDVTGSHVIREPESVILNVTKDRFTKETAKLDGIETAGYLLPLTQENDSLWPGYDTFGVSPHFHSIDIVFDQISGPGNVYAFTSGSFGGAMQAIAADGRLQLGTGSVFHVANPSHTHMYWLFSKPGNYRFIAHAQGKNKQGRTIASRKATYTWVVGSTASAQPGSVTAPQAQSVKYRIEGRTPSGEKCDLAATGISSLTLPLTIFGFGIGFLGFAVIVTRRTVLSGSRHS